MDIEKWYKILDGEDAETWTIRDIQAWLEEERGMEVLLSYLLARAYMYEKQNNS